MSTRLLLAVAVVQLSVASASAQVFGTFPWQMQPYCNTVTLTLRNTPAGFTLDGTDDQCGATNRASAVGVAAFGAGGDLALNFSIVLAPAGKPVHVSGIVSPATGSGTWKDSVGNSGTFAFFGTTPGLPPRPLPASGLPPGIITSTELANDAVTGAKVVNGSLTSVDVLDGPRLAHGGGNLLLDLTSASAIVRSATITAPAAGRVLAQAAVIVEFRDTSAVEEIARCSLDTGASVTAAHIVLIGDGRSTSAVTYQSLAALRGFTVQPGPFTVNLVCDEYAGAARVFNAYVALTYSAQ